MKPEMQGASGYVPAALQQVWQWKAAIYAETKHLAPREVLQEILKRAHAVAVAEGFTEPSHALVESSPPYREKPAA